MRAFVVGGKEVIREGSGGFGRTFPSISGDYKDG